MIYCINDKRVAAAQVNAIILRIEINGRNLPVIGVLQWFFSACLLKILIRRFFYQISFFRSILLDVASIVCTVVSGLIHLHHAAVYFSIPVLF